MKAGYNHFSPLYDAVGDGDDARILRVTGLGELKT